MILPPFLAGDVWTWRVTLRYADASGPLLEDRERWTIRVAEKGAFTAEREFVGTVIEGAVVPGPKEPPETLKGKVGPDGTLKPEGSWSDPATDRALRRLLKPDAKADEPLVGWPLVWRTTLREENARLPGSDLRGGLRVEVNLEKARLGGTDLSLTPAPLPRKGEGF